MPKVSCVQTSNLFTRSHNDFLHMSLALLSAFASFFVFHAAIVFGCSLLFAHDGAASTAIWLIKSVIELCDMNNLLLFSRTRISSCSSLSFRVPPCRGKAQAKAENVLCVLHTTVENIKTFSTFSISTSSSLSFILFRQHKKQIVNINSKLLNMHQLVLFAFAYMEIIFSFSSVCLSL